METNKKGKKLNIGVSSGVIGFIMLASFLYKKLNQPTKQDVNNQINVPSVNPTYGFEPKPAAYNNFGSGNRLNPNKEDVDFSEINSNEFLQSKPENFEMPKYNYDKDILKDYLESKPENFEIPKHNIDKDILKDISRSDKFNAGFQKILDTL